MPRHTRGSSRGPEHSRKRDRLRDPFAGNGDTQQGFSNFAVQESQELDLEHDHEHDDQDEDANAISMTARQVYLGGDRENLLKAGAVSQPTQV